MKGLGTGKKVGQEVKQNLLSSFSSLSHFLMIRFEAADFKGKMKQVRALDN
jgi:hypothetical protein